VGSAEALVIIDDLGMRKLPLTGAEDLLEIITTRYERCSTLVRSQNTIRPSIQRLKCLTTGMLSDVTSKVVNGEGRFVTMLGR
jgi:DNA replication protein DnaC